jgi:hypothetical protein
VIKRIFKTALIFGGAGGGALGATLGIGLAFGESSENVLQRVWGAFGITLFGALVGVVAAVPALFVAALAGSRAGRGDRGRIVGTASALLLTLAAEALIFWGAIYNGWTIAIFGGAAIYGSLVAWLRLPWILKDGPTTGG